MAFTCGLLVLTKPITALYSRIPSILKEVSHHVHETLYVHLAPGIVAQTRKSSLVCNFVLLQEEEYDVPFYSENILAQSELLKTPKWLWFSMITITYDTCRL